MRIKTLLTKTLLVVAGLLIGSNAWAVEVTETYDFYTYAYGLNAGADATENFSLTGDELFKVDNNSMKLVSDLAGMPLNGRFAAWTNSNNMYVRRKSGKDNNSGVFCNVNKNARFSILNLKDGDRIQFLSSTNNAIGIGTVSFSTGTDIKKVEDEEEIAVSKDEELTLNTVYVVRTESATTHIDLTFGAYGYFHKVTITTTKDNDHVSAPVLNITGTSGNSRFVTVTPGISDFGNTVHTYYTTNGNEPTSSDSEYSGTPVEVSTACTFKAISIAEGISSTVSSLEVAAGTYVTLPTPSIVLSNVTGSSVYHAVATGTVSSTDIYGNETGATLSYSFQPTGGAEAAVVAPYTINESGTFKVTASADGYASSSITYDFSGSYVCDYASTRYNEIAAEDVTTILGESWVVTDQTGRWSGWIDGTYTYYKRDGLADASNSNVENLNLRGVVQLLIGGGLGRGSNENNSKVINLAAGKLGLVKTFSGTMKNTYSQICFIGDGTSKGFSLSAGTCIQQVLFFRAATAVDLAILDCKAYESSSAFATAIDEESFDTPEEVYAFHTQWQIAQADASSSLDYTKVIRNAAIADGTDWNGAVILNGQQYTGAPDAYYLDRNGSAFNVNQTIYGLPAGKYQIKVATRANADTYSHVYVNAGSGDICTTRGTHAGNADGELGNGWAWTYVPFEITETSNVLIGFYGNTVGGWASCDDWHLYKVTADYPVEMTSAGWATLYTPYALNFAGTGLEAYTATLDEERSFVTLNPVTTVPERTGVVLKGVTGNYNIPLAVSSSTDRASLKGSVTWATNYDANYNFYYLALNDESNAQFTLLAEGGSIAAGKAYLQTSKANGARSFRVVYADEPTGISSVDAVSAENGQTYNLAGQRVANPQKGLFIKNGKKVIVK